MSDAQQPDDLRTALQEVRRYLCALDAYYAAMKYLPTTEPRVQLLEALALIDAAVS